MNETLKTKRVCNRCKKDFNSDMNSLCETCRANRKYRKKKI